jgi:hypothetical protein
MLLILILLILLFGGGGWWFGNRGGGAYGPHFGIGAILLVVIVIWLLGGFSGAGLRLR